MGQEQSGWRTQDRCEEAIEKSTYYLTCAPSPDRERFIPTNTSTGNYVAQSWDGFMDREACFHSIQNQVGGDVCVRQSIGVFTAFDTVTSQPSYINSGSFSSLQSCIDNLR